MCQSVHPLGRAMDQLQEDLEAMQREYAHWQQERVKWSRELARASPSGIESMYRI